MKELFAAYGEVPANVNFLGYGSEKQTQKYKQIWFLWHVVHGREEKDHEQQLVQETAVAQGGHISLCIKSKLTMG